MLERNGGGCARMVTPEEALRILEAMDRECEPGQPLGAVAEAQAPSDDGHCHAAGAGPKASPVGATSGGAAARTGPARCGPESAILQGKILRRAQAITCAEDSGVAGSKTDVAGEKKQAPLDYVPALLASDAKIRALLVEQEVRITVPSLPLFLCCSRLRPDHNFRQETIAERDATIAEQGKQIQERDAVISELCLQLASLSAPVEQGSQQTPFAERLARRTMGKMQSAAVTRHPAWGPGDDLLVQLKMLQPRLRDLRARRLSGRP